MAKVSLTLRSESTFKNGDFPAFHRQRLLQRVIKDSIPGLVVEVGKHHRVFFCERRRLWRLIRTAPWNASAGSNHRQPVPRSQ